MTNHSLFTGPAKSCSNTLLRQIASCVLESAFLWKSLSTHTYIYMCNRILLLQQVTKKIKWYWICVTCCWDKTLLQRQRYYSQKLSIIDKAICRCDVSPWHVAAACRLVSTDLNGSYVKHKNNCTWKIVQWSFPCVEHFSTIHENTWIKISYS